MENFFQGIIDSFSAIMQMFLDVCSAIVDFIEMIPQMLTFFSSCSSYLPNWCVSFGVAAICVAIIMTIMGRSHD